MGFGLTILLVFGLIFGISGIRILRPTERGLIEFLGKYKRFATTGFNWIFPLIENLYRVNITEMLDEAEPQEIITNDNLNAIVDAQIYYKVRATENDVKNAIYNANNYANQIVNLTRTTLRNIIGTMSMKAANSERNRREIA